MTGSFKLFFGRWFGVVILAAVAGLIIWFILNFNSVYYKAQNKLFATDAQREIKRLENLYKNDKYGGKTPEETFDLFLAALKSGNIELASKYFVINKQDDWERTLGEYKNKNLLLDFISEIEKNRSGWKLLENNGEIARYSYTFVVETPFEEELPITGGKTQKLTHPAGEFGAEIIFGRYLGGVWKISLL